MPGGEVRRPPQPAPPRPQPSRNGRNAPSADPRWLTGYANAQTGDRHRANIIAKISALPRSGLILINTKSWRTASIDRPQLVTTMNRFFNKRAMHNTAFMVLLAWLFALASGVANACLLEPTTNPFHVGSADPFGKAGSPVQLGVPAEPGVGHGYAVDTSRAPCLKVCNDATQSLTKPQSGVDQTDPGPPGTATVLWVAAAPLVMMSQRMAEVRPVTLGPPIRLRYPRLLL